jgi:Flp pilus assembly protein TadB
MPLSEQEQRLLEEMERSLYHNDADFVATVGSHGTRPDYRMIVVGILIAIAGIAGIVTGVATRLPVVGIAGFVVMFVGVLLALRRSSGSSAQPSAAEDGSTRRPGFMDRMNDRWDRRQEEQGR